MELPTELWSLILLKTRSIQSCNKLYNALSQQTKDELKEIYYSHKERLNIKIFCGLHNKLTIFNNNDNNDNNDNFEFELDDIFAVRYIKNWDTSIGKKIALFLQQKPDSSCFGMPIQWDIFKD